MRSAGRVYKPVSGMDIWERWGCWRAGRLSEILHNEKHQHSNRTQGGVSCISEDSHGQKFCSRQMFLDIRALLQMYNIMSFGQETKIGSRTLCLTGERDIKPYFEKYLEELQQHHQLRITKNPWNPDTPIYSSIHRILSEVIFLKDESLFARL